MALTLEELRDFVSSALSDSSLQLVLDAAYQDIDKCIGSAGGDVSEVFTVAGDLIYLSRRADAITSVTENMTWASLTLEADDYELRRSGRMLVRLHTGTNPRYRWQGRTEVTYFPFDDTATRDRVAVELVQLSIAFNPALRSQTIGTWSETYSTDVPYAKQRTDILATLNEPGVV